MLKSVHLAPAPPALHRQSLTCLVHPACSTSYDHVFARALPPGAQSSRRLPNCNHHRRAACLKALGDGGSAGTPDQSSADLLRATDAVERLLAFVTASDHDGVLTLIADDVIDAVLEHHRAQKIDRHITLKDVIDLNNRADGLQVDSYGERFLFYTPPRSATRLSSLMIKDDACVHRYAVTAASGETSTLTVTMSLQDTLKPQYRGSPRLEPEWRLQSVTGESAADDPSALLKPCRSQSPEAVVKAQLAALRASEAATIFAFASPANKVVTGPVERFSQLLHNPMYRPLLGHAEALPFKRSMTGESSYVELVVVVSGNTGLERGVRMLYLWELSRQGPSAQEYENCWMTDSVQLISATVTKWPPS